MDDILAVTTEPEQGKGASMTLRQKVMRQARCWSKLMSASPSYPGIRRPGAAYTGATSYRHAGGLC